MFNDYETSARGGKPTHLFLFGRQSLAWRYAACDHDVEIGGKTYTAAAISRSEIKQTSEKPQDEITITLPYVLDPNATEKPATQDLGDNWNPFVPSDPVSVICMATHLNDPDQEIATEWIGQVAQPKYTDGQLELTCQPPGQISKALYQGARWSRGCWKTLYSKGPRGCNLDPDSVRISATVTAIDGVNVTAAEFAGATLTLAGGFLEFTRPDGLTERRSIMSWAQGSQTVALLYPIPSLVVGASISVLPGCEHTWAACVARHNTVNYGGSVYLPVQDPMNKSMSWG